MSLGAYSGKLLTIYISPSGVRVVEGENRSGNPSISRFFTVPAVEEFFMEIPGTAGKFEVTNMSGLVGAILEECANQRTSAKRVVISSNCFEIQTTVSSEESKTRDFMKMLSADLGSGKKDKTKNKEKGSLGLLSCKVSWGDLISDGKAMKQTTTTTGDKFVLQSLTQEFYSRGYTVVSVSDCIGTLMNFRQAEEATFDHQGKVIFDFDTCFTTAYLSKDLPVAINPVSSMDSFELQERIVPMVQDAVDQVGRSPIIFLTGSMMRDTMLYASLIDRLESMGYAVYDLFERPEVDPDTGLEPGTGRPVLTPDYAINCAMLMSAYAKNVVALQPKVGMNVLFEQNSKALAGIALVIALAFVGFTGFTAAMTMLDVMDMNNNPPRVDSLQSQINSLTAQQTQLQNTLGTLTQADVTVLDTINFVYANQSPLINIVSIDTVDMINTTTVDSGNTTPGTYVDANGNEIYAGASGATGTDTARQAIKIRGYARTAEAAIDFYNRLFHYDLPVDPVLKGVEKFILPNGYDEVHIFEIEIEGFEVGSLPMSNGGSTDTTPETGGVEG